MGTVTPHTRATAASMIAVLMPARMVLTSAAPTAPAIGTTLHCSASASGARGALSANTQPGRSAAIKTAAAAECRVIASAPKINTAMIGALAANSAP